MRGNNGIERELMGLKLMIKFLSNIITAIVVRVNFDRGGENTKVDFHKQLSLLSILRQHHLYT